MNIGIIYRPQKWYFQKLLLGIGVTNSLYLSKKKTYEIYHVLSKIDQNLSKILRKMETKQRKLG